MDATNDLGSWSLWAISEELEQMRDDFEHKSGARYEYCWALSGAAGKYIAYCYLCKSHSVISLPLAQILHQMQTFTPFIDKSSRSVMIF